MGAAASQLQKQAPVVLLDAEDADSSQIRRHASSPDALVETVYDDVHTLADGFQRGRRLAGDGPCLGWREGDGAFQWLSYNQVWENAQAFGSALCKLGLEPGNQGKNFMGIYSINQPKWSMAEQGCNAYSLVTVPLYDTLGPEAVTYIVSQAEISVLSCSHAAVQAIIKQLDTFPDVCTSIIQLDDAVEEDEKKALADKGITLYSWDEIIAMGKENMTDPQPPKPDDLATICYTSGTTGDPKGVMLSHKNIIADASGAMISGVQLNVEDVHISYLPLAHMFERIVQVTCLASGASIGFYRGDVLKLFDDIAELKPTLFPSVPRLFNRLYDKVMGVINQTTGIKKFLFDTAWQAKRENLVTTGQLTHAVYDSLVFQKIKDRLGGRVRLMITGSAPISAPVMEFLMICFGVPVLEGYGQTESTAASSVTSGNTFGHVGAPVACNEVKLVSVPDMDYLVTDEQPRGEVCFRGNNVTQGYYKMPEKTSEAIDKDGWLHSGDIGMFTPEGWLKIIDRKKNIFKLAQGEYIAPEKIENCFAQDPFVAQSFVFGDSLQACLVAIIVPDVEVLTPWAEKQGIEGDFATLCKNEKVIEHVKASITETGKAVSLRGFEFPKAITLHHELFSVANDILTPTFKLKRPQAQKMFQAEIDSMYASIPN